jgi:DNA-binding transcriptional LysR family regulator
VLCHRILMDLDEAERTVVGEQSVPRGTLTITASVAAGDAILRPILDSFMESYPELSLRLDLSDRPTNLIEQGIDLALRIATLADSNLVAVKVGEVRRVVAASPSYIARSPAIETPGDLAKHPIIAMTHFGVESWSFPAASMRRPCSRSERRS